MPNPYAEAGVDTAAGDLAVELMKSAVSATHNASVLGGLATDQRGARRRAAAGDPGDDVGDAVRHDAPAGDVVGHEQRLRTDHHDVVDDHADQVLPDGVVLVDRLGDGDLRADAVGRGREQRV